MNVGSEKMSKSLNNFFTIKDVLKEFDPLVVRFFLLNTHYRKPIDFNDTALEEAERSLGRLQNTLDNTRSRLDKADASIIDGMAEIAEQAIKNFDEAMDNDFNSRDAIASIFDLVREVNKYLEGGSISKASIEAIIAAFDEFDDRLTIFKDPTGGMGNEVVEELMQVLIDLRQEAREKKDWALADSIRDKLKELGITIEDTSDGVRWKSG